MGGGGACSFAGSKRQTVVVVLRHLWNLHLAQMTSRVLKVLQQIWAAALFGTCALQKQQNRTTMKRLGMSVAFGPRESPYWKHITFDAPIFELVGAHSCHIWMP